MSGKNQEGRNRPWRIVSLETALGLAGLALFAAGLATRHTIGIFWGVIIVGGLILLHRIRKKDWQAHWEERNRQLPPKQNDRSGGDDER